MSPSLLILKLWCQPSVTEHKELRSSLKLIDVTISNIVHGESRPDIVIEWPED